MKKILLLVILIAAVLPAADAITRLRNNIDFHTSFYLHNKTGAAFPRALTDEGRFKLTGAGDFFSRAMDTWGLTVLNAKAPDEIFSILETIEQWCGQHEARCRSMLAVLEQIGRDIRQTPPAAEGSELPGEFGLFAALARKGKPADLDGAIRLLSDLDRWTILNCTWLRTHAQLIRKYKENFRGGWDTLGTQETFLGTSLMQRVQDLAEIQRMYEDMLDLSEREAALYASCRECPPILTAEARLFYTALIPHISPAARTVLDCLLETPYEQAYVNVQFTWYALAAEGADFCARQLAAAIGRLEKNADPLLPKGLAELINYRQGEVYCGYNPGSRFHPQLSTLWAWEGEPDIIIAAGDAVGRIHAYYTQHMTYGASPDIAAAFKTGRADCYRMSNLLGAALANQGFGGIYPIRSGRQALVGLRAGAAIVTCDPLSGDAPARRFPEDCIAQGRQPAEIYTRTIGGWVCRQAILMPQAETVTIPIPY